MKCAILWTQGLGCTITWQRQVYGCAFAIASADLSQSACAGVQAGLVGGYEKHRRVIKEYVVRAIAVVHVEIKDQHLRAHASLVPDLILGTFRIPVRSECCEEICSANAVACILVATNTEASQQKF